MSTVCSPLQVPVLVVPIPPISISTFNKYLLALESISVVNLEEVVSPPSETCKFTKQLFHDGHVYLRYIRDYRKDLAYLGDLELFRHVFAVRASWNSW